MKIQLDTGRKIINVEESVNLGELISALKELLPRGRWKEFELQAHIVMRWSEPYKIREYPYSPLYDRPWWRKDSGGIVGQPHNYSLNSGTYNIQI